MNNPKNLRKFMQIMGVPFRPYREVYEELALTLLQKIFQILDIDKKNKLNDITKKNNNLKH